MEILAQNLNILTITKLVTNVLSFSICKSNAFSFKNVIRMYRQNVTIANSKDEC